MRSAPTCRSELKGILSGALLSMAREDPEALDAVDRLGFGGGGFATPDASLYALVVALVTPRRRATDDRVRGLMHRPSAAHMLNECFPRHGKESANARPTARLESLLITI